MGVELIRTPSILNHGPCPRHAVVEGVLLFLLGFDSLATVCVNHSHLE